MYVVHKSERWGFMFSTYSVCRDANDWDLHAGFGGKAEREEAVLGPPYRYGFSITWRKLSDCVYWWADYLGTERGRGVVIQYRICGFRQWPLSIQFYKAP